jgi:hypothetical protein
MSWDIFVQDIPTDVKSVEEIPRDFKPRPLGKPQEIIARILEVAKDADFTNPEWGTIDGPDFSIEISISNRAEISGFAFHVRGGDEAAFVIADILQYLGLRAFDPNSDTGIFSLHGDSLAGFQRWRSYRNQVVGEGRAKAVAPKPRSFFSKLLRR